MFNIIFLYCKTPWLLWEGRLIHGSTIMDILKINWWGVSGVSGWLIREYMWYSFILNQNSFLLCFFRYKITRTLVERKTLLSFINSCYVTCVWTCLVPLLLLAVWHGPGIRCTFCKIKTTIDLETGFLPNLDSSRPYDPDMRKFFHIFCKIFFWASSLTVSILPSSVSQHVGRDTVLGRWFSLWLTK